MVSGMSIQFQADIADLKGIVNFNDDYRYILTCIDVFSKYAWAFPLKRKDSSSIISSFKEIFKERKPIKLQTDQGKEFLNKNFQSYLKKAGVHFFFTFNHTKSSIVERFNRTLKTKLWKYFTAKNTFRYIDVLEDIMKSYNNTYHTSIKMEPAKVTKENEKQVFNNLYQNLPNQKRYKCTFKIGEAVRISKSKMVFEKGYENNWSEEIFIINHCISRIPPVYKIKDLMGEEIKGTFYTQELQRVILPETFPVEKILKKRFHENKLEYLVKFKGYPSKFNAWLPSNDLFVL
nr:TPA_asm: integrase [Parasteatoda house spider adintovirus]